jgi:hypothetical protein
MRRRAVTAILFVLFVYSGCKEPFPSYQEPSDVLRASLRRISSDTVYTYLDSTGTTMGMDEGRFVVDVKNNYQQLLEGEAKINGRVTFYSYLPTPGVSIVSLGRTNLNSPPIFQNHIAVAPGDSATLEVTWSYWTSSGTVYAGQPYQEYFVGRTRVRTYAPVFLTAEAEIQIFSKVQAIRTKPIQFSALFIELKLNAIP